MWRRRSKQSFVNLSGKKTFIGRNSGECLHFVCKPPKKQASGFPDVNLSGETDRDSRASGEVSFFMGEIS
ncbi:hypothetical protein SAMN05192559_102287 [Halobacillus karajensis]|uniref:Uncharacterized protein n=1 Tax=Halobacillus karajensis TaxID=195088 RepID=A0A024P619_9BACI|nr:hypothetical protein BN982_00158 [Halobacillus karajensis]CDQ24325.1 hypothetical protein BN983_02598 [Halobacillus karajensis]CDQ29426.1 hypothetical protein BN981_03808 [Halobacillus karajensis]SEH61650.1 hypothetical protein SAMN05192559_102287 [Halobacillus karajensis]